MCFVLLQQIETKWNRNESCHADNSRLGSQFDSQDQQHVVVQQSRIVEYCGEVGNVSVEEGEPDVGEGDGRGEVERNGEY